jgi:hypothetical protein
VSRSPEQVAADEALTAVIEGVLQAYDDGDAWLLAEYVVITSQQRYDDDGDLLTAVGALYRDGSVPTHRALGLVEHAAVRLRGRITDME